MTAIPPADDISFWEKAKLKLFNLEWIDKVNYRNEDGGTTYLRRRKSHAENLKADLT